VEEGLPVKIKWKERLATALGHTVDQFTVPVAECRRLTWLDRRVE
jgi:hypothetical protein